MSRTYLDFDLSVATEGSGYRITARFGGAAAEHQFTIPFDDDELGSFLDMFGGARRRKMESPQMERTRAFGDRLYRAVFGEDLDSLLKDSMRQAEADGRGLRIRLHLDDAPVLVNLPWEYLYRRTADGFPVLSNWTPLVRYLPVEEGLAPAPVDPPLKILVMISNPVEYQDTLDTQAELDRLRSALAPQLASGLVEISALPKATEAELQATLRRTDVHIFHFIGHGEFSDQEQDGVLLLEDEFRRTTLVTGESLGTILQDCRTLRLVVLNNCEGARAADVDPFAGVAQSLLRKSIPAVVAMQFEVTDKAAIAFSQEFYGGLGDGFPVEAALAEARKSMSRVGGGFEFGSPVLYLAAPNGEIFDVTGRDVAVPKEDDEEEDRKKKEEQRKRDEADQRKRDEEQRRKDQDEEDQRKKDEEEQRKKDEEEQRKRDGDEQRRKDQDEQKRKRRARTIWALLGALLAVIVVVLVVVNLPGPDEDADGTQPTETPGTTGLDLRGGGPAGDFAAVHLGESPTIDGDGSDWPSGTQYPTPYEAEGESNPRVSSEWRLAWDDNALYLFVAVTDPEVMVRHASEPWLLYRGDGIDLIFGADPNRLGSELLRDDDIQVSIGPDTPEADSAVAGRQVPTTGSSNTDSDCAGSVFGTGAAAPEIETVARRTGLGYEIEARVPWTVLGQSPDTGVVYGTILTVSDVADDGSRRGSRSSNPDREAAKHCPSQWQTVELLP